MRSIDPMRVDRRACVVVTQSRVEVRVHRWVRLHVLDAREAHVGCENDHPFVPHIVVFCVHYETSTGRSVTRSVGHRTTVGSVPPRRARGSTATPPPPHDGDARDDDPHATRWCAWNDDDDDEMRSVERDRARGVWICVVRAGRDSGTIRRARA